jgi:hypothetical protein
MKTKLLWCLVGVNLALLAALVLQHTGSNAAMAQQRANPSTARDYVLIPAAVAGSDNSVIYVVNETDNQLGAWIYEEGRGQGALTRPIDLGRVFGDEKPQLREDPNTRRRY